MSNPEFLDARLTERRNPRSVGIDVASSLEIVDLMQAEDELVLAAVRECREDVARAADLAVQAFQAGGRLLYVGAGTSGRLGVLDASECPPTFGTDPRMVTGIIAGGSAALTRSQEGAEDDEEAGSLAMSGHKVSERDFVFGIAASGSTPYVRGALARARQIGASTGFLSCSRPSADIVAVSDVVITALVGPEVLTGSTRLKAGTATKLVLNAITTAAMIRLGKAYGNFMVDLQAVSEKLVDRAERIVMETAEVDRGVAREVLEAAGGRAKTAIVMARLGAGRQEAEDLLAKSGGFLRPALGDPPDVFSE